VEGVTSGFKDSTCGISGEGYIMVQGVLSIASLVMLINAHSSLFILPALSMNVGSND
jgi:hypothetical protein